MHRLPDFSAIIFDMDGLVLDTETTYVAAWQQAARDMGYEFPEAFCLSMSGLHSNVVEQRLMDFCGADFNLDKFVRLSADFWRQYVNVHGINTKKGFDQLLALIAELEIPYCLATNSPQINAYQCLEFAGVRDVFSTVVTRDHVRQGKPEPEIFLKAAELLDVDIRRCLVIEDSHAGIEAASRAGSFSVLIPSVLPVDPLTAELCDVMMEDLAQLADLIGAGKWALETALAGPN
ncbi:HAD family phosphatase [Methylobacter sp. BlB1]|uniref:HAD family hydrolase n=1 Tax=Methylobacter sp. BlB1 TaxID=2785914 RepID=UPI001893B1C7|nr:HAD family phosphatase [Methylobacter sp. BlB1]MBF6649263.1 HAD family phosphatase [Methylobacter sp. BlB1]